MICQTYNSGNKSWVKLDTEGGRILENAKQKFEGCPVHGEKESELEVFEQKTELADDIPVENEKEELEHKELDNKKAGKDNWSFFEW